MDSDIVLDHVAISTTDLSECEQFYELLGLKVKGRERVEEQKVDVAFLPVDEHAKIELLQSFDPKGPIAQFISKRGAGIHHLCFKVKDIETKTKELEKAGVKFLYEAPKKGAHNMLINFIHPKSTGGVLIELAQPLGQEL